MKIKHFDYLRMTMKFSVLGTLLYISTAAAQDYECMLVQARLVNKYISSEDAARGQFPSGAVVLEGMNFGSDPNVYFGSKSAPAEIMSVGRSNNLDSMTLKLPEGTRPGTYKLIIQNTTGPFLDNDGKTNPIFCFGSVTVGYVSQPVP